jgi:hypothetical protein
MRPELTKRSINIFLQWDDLKQVIVIVDGLRSAAESNEKLWRNETIRAVENIAEIDSRVELWVYDDNIGNTNHILRVQERALFVEEYGIWLEEDIDLELDGYLRLQNSIKRSDRPLILTGYSHCNHGSSLSYKNTLFVPLWGQTINHALFERVSKTWKDKHFDSKIMKRVISGVFEYDRRHNPRYFSRVLDYWTSYSEWGVKSSRRWDALANYSLWLDFDFSFSSTERIAHDVSYLDYRGMNQRSKPKDVPVHELTTIEFEGGRFCMGCERVGSRQVFSKLKRISNSLVYRWRKISRKLDTGQKKPQWYKD